MENMIAYKSRENSMVRRYKVPAVLLADSNGVAELIGAPLAADHRGLTHTAVCVVNSIFGLEGVRSVAVTDRSIHVGVATPTGMDKIHTTIAGILNDTFCGGNARFAFG